MRGDALQSRANTDDEVFKATYIPYSLHEVEDPEREIELQQRKAKAPDAAAPNGFQDLVSAPPEKPVQPAIVSTKAPCKPTSSSAVSLQTPESAEASSSSDNDEDSDSESDNSDSEDLFHPKDAKLTKEEARALKKEAKKETKAANRENRKTKMPKSEKKRRLKKGHK